MLLVAPSAGAPIGPLSEPALSAAAYELATFAGAGLAATVFAVETEVDASLSGIDIAGDGFLLSVETLETGFI